jgi:hypothetical protein
VTYRKNVLSITDQVEIQEPLLEGIRAIKSQFGWSDYTLAEVLDLDVLTLRKWAEYRFIPFVRYSNEVTALIDLIAIKNYLSIIFMEESHRAIWLRTEYQDGFTPTEYMSYSFENIKKLRLHLDEVRYSGIYE